MGLPCGNGFLRGILGIWYTWRGSFVGMGSGDEEYLKII
jgi:hypothetical protein